MFLIERLRKADVEPAAQLLTEVFLDNPCYAFMHPRVSMRRSDLHAFFLRNLRWREPLGLTWIARAGTGRVAATATLQPPGSVRRGVVDTLRHWVLPTVREQGFHTFLRIARVEREFAREERRAAAQASYWYVHAVAVRPELQSRGLGTAIMRRLLSELELRQRRHDAPAVLATQEEKNVHFYGQLGFRLCGQSHIGKGWDHPGFVSYFMRYEPTAREASASAETSS